MSGHFKPDEKITDDQWAGNIPVCPGSIWMTDAGKMQARKYQCWFGGAEIIGDGESAKLVKADIDSDGYNFSIFGIVRSILTVRKIGEVWSGDCFDLARDHPRQFEKYARYLRGEAFDSYVGRMFIKRLPELLDYHFDLEKILGLKEEKS